MTGLVPAQDPDAYLCSCHKPIRQCPFWMLVKEHMLAKGHNFDPGNFGTRFRLGNTSLTKQLSSGSLRSTLLEDLRDGIIDLWPVMRRRLGDVVARNKALADSILRASGKQVFFDASKDPMAIRHFERDADIRLQVVHMVRDVRGVALSRIKNRGEMNWNRAVSAWLRMNRSIDRELRRVPEATWIRIRYEDLCRDPTGTMNRFFQFCGLDDHDVGCNFSSEEHHIVGNRMRLTSISAIRLDETWRRTLTSVEVERASRIAGSLHRKYGYPAMKASELVA